MTVVGIFGMLGDHAPLFKTGSDQKVETHGQCHIQTVDTLAGAGQQHQHHAAIHRMTHMPVNTADNEWIDIVLLPSKPYKCHGVNRSKRCNHHDASRQLYGDKQIKQQTIGII